MLPHSTVFVMVTGDATYSKVVEAGEDVLHAENEELAPGRPGRAGERRIELRRVRAEQSLCEDLTTGAY